MMRNNRRLCYLLSFFKRRLPDKEKRCLLSASAHNDSSKGNSGGVITIVSEPPKHSILDLLGSLP